MLLGINKNIKTTAHQWRLCI